MIHPTAEVSSTARIGEGTKVWNHAQIREGVRLGSNCIIGKDVYIDLNVVLGDNVKVENGALIYHGVSVEDGVFIGPHACFVNDPIPRAITTSGKLKTDDDWEAGQTRVRHGASIGAGVIVLTNLVIGEWAMVGAGAVVTHDVPAHALVVGSPARRVGFVCKCGRKLVRRKEVWICGMDGLEYRVGHDGGLTPVRTGNDPDL